jgi:hypothetical protein
MTEGAAGRVSVELTMDEARLVVAALRQLEPYWPDHTDEMSRAEMLADIRRAIDHVTAAARP